MNFICALTIFVIGCFVLGQAFTRCTNYLDTNVNPTLNVAAFLGLTEIDTSSRDKVVAANKRLLPLLSLLTKLKIIRHEMTEEVSKKRYF